MTQQTRTALKELQRLDLEIESAKQAIHDFDPLFAEVEEPALVLESEATTTRSRLKEMKLEERRLELASEEKRTRVKRLEERLGGVRNLREEAAVSAELDMVRRALQSDEQEAFTMMDQIRKLDERLEEVEAGLSEAKGILEPRVEELKAQREEARAALAKLESDREAFAATMDGREIQLYDAIRAGGRRLAVAELTEDGACGHCFGMIPLQLQNEIRHGTALIRCEACGVIVAASDPNRPAEAVKAPAPAPAATDAAVDAAGSEGAQHDEDVDGEEAEAGAVTEEA